MQSIKLKIENYIWLGLMVVCTLLLAGCSKDDVPEEEKVNPTLVMYIYVPDQLAATRAENLSVNATAAESAIHTLQMWVFGWGRIDESNEDLENNIELKSIPVDDGAYNNTCGCLYKELTNVSLASGMKEVIFSVPRDFKQKYPKLDVYVIGNAASIAAGGSLGPNTTRETLRELKITGEEYGVTASDTYYYPTTSTVGSDGLPMSACVEGADVVRSGTAFSITQLSLERAVSKFRFVFSRAEPGSSGIIDARVTGIQFDGYMLYSGQTAQFNNGNIFPTYEYLFADLEHTAEGELANISKTYSIGVIDVQVPTIPAEPAHQIPEHENPWVLRWDHEETRQEWEDKIAQAITAGKAVACGPYYMRETNRILSGTISYEIDSEDIHAPTGYTTHAQKTRFSMNANYGFLRNHTWTIYAYFSEGGAMFEVDNWDSTEDVTFKPFK